MAIALVDGFTAKSDFIPVKTNDELLHGLVAYIQRMENLLRSESLTIKNIFLDLAREDNRILSKIFASPTA